MNRWTVAVTWVDEVRSAYHVPESTLPLSGVPDLPLLEVLESLKLIASRSEGRRLVAQGAVSIDGATVGDPTLRLSAGNFLVRVGKRRFARVVLE